MRFMAKSERQVVNLPLNNLFRTKILSQIGMIKMDFRRFISCF